MLLCLPSGTSAPCALSAPAQASFAVKRHNAARHSVGAVRLAPGADPRAGREAFRILMTLLHCMLCKLRQQRLQMSLCSYPCPVYLLLCALNAK